MDHRPPSSVDSALADIGDELYSTLLQLSPDAIALLSPDLIYLMANHQTLLLHGFDSLDEMLNRSAAELVHPEEVERLPVLMEQLFRDGTLKGIELRLLRKDGSSFLSETHASLVRSPAGVPRFIIIIGRDLSERKELETELRQRESRLSTILATSQDGYLQVGADGRVMEVNDAYCRMVGYSREELLAMTVDQLEVGESEEEIRARMARIMETGSDLFLAHHRRKDGSVVVLEACMNHDPSVGGLLFGFLRDITERIASEAKVRSSEERYRLLFANNPAPMWVYDLETLAFIDVNRAAVRHYGYSRNEFLAMKISDIRPPEDVPLLLAEVSGVTEGLDKAGVWHHLKKDGSLISVEIISHTIDFDGHRAELVMSLDVTEREEITRNLRIKSRAIESSLNGVALADLEGRITYVNPSFLRIWGFTREEQVLGRFSTLFWQRPEDAEAVMVSVLKEGTWTGTLNARRHDGSIFNAEVGASLVMDNNGTPLCLMATFIDITERWQAEQENRRLKEELERRVEDRTAQLTASNRELESFCYSVSHDLRTPLRAIAGFSAILRENYAHLLDPEGEDSLLRIERGATTMGALIDDLLTLSRVSRHQMTTEPVDLSALCHEILGQLVSAHPEQQAEAVIEPGITVTADPVLMRQALHNLLENAWKYTSRTPSPRIEFGCRYDEGQQVCFVRDNGAGFDMAFSHKLFGTFERLHSVNEFEGTGIGLATVKRIMERHGGRVWGEGKRGEGATFSFSIPVLQGTPRSP